MRRRRPMAGRALRTRPRQPTAKSAVPVIAMRNARPRGSGRIAAWIGRRPVGGEVKRVSAARRGADIHIPIVGTLWKFSGLKWLVEFFMNLSFKGQQYRVTKRRWVGPIGSGGRRDRPQMTTEAKIAQMQGPAQAKQRATRRPMKKAA